MGKGIAVSKMVWRLWLAVSIGRLCLCLYFFFLALSLSLPILDMSDGLQLCCYMLIACLKRSLFE